MNVMADRLEGALRGHFTLRVLERGALLYTLEEPNLVVAGVRAVIAALLGGEPGTAVTHFGVGTGSTAPTLADTSLTNAVLVPINGVTYPQAGHVAFSWILGTGSANGLTIREFGLYSGGATLVARKVLAEGIPKTVQISLESTWTLYYA